MLLEALCQNVTGIIPQHCAPIIVKVLSITDYYTQKISKSTKTKCFPTP